MKQIIQDMANKVTRVVEVPVPKPGTGMALVKTAASIVSAGTERMTVQFAEKSLLNKALSRPDLVRQTIQKAQKDGLLSTYQAVKNRLDQFLLLGYSSAGIIVEVGEGLSGYHIGDRVACAGGGYAVHAEYAVVPQNLLTRLPDSVDFESGAYATLGAIALHAFRLGGAQIGEHVAVIGLGLLGLIACQIAEAAGCSVMGTDLSADRVNFAKKLGLNAVLRNELPEMAPKETNGIGFDTILICASTESSDPVELAGEIARDRAMIVALGAVGLTIPRKMYYEKELSFIVSRSYGPGRYDPSYEEQAEDYPISYVRWTEGRNLEGFVDLLSTGRVMVEPLTTHRFPIEEAAEAYEMVKKYTEGVLGVLITYRPDDEKRSRKIFLREATGLVKDGLTIGVFGAGNFASSVMLPILEDSRDTGLSGIVTESGISAQHAAAKFGFSYASSDENEVLEDEGINAVVILTRHHLHAHQIISSLGAGKHVFCEKPLALNQTELDQILDAYQASDGLLMVGFNRRFSTFAQQLKSFLGSVPSPLVLHYRINAGSLPASHWLLDPKIGGGRIIGECCHFLDLLTFLNGSLPIRVHTVGVGEAEGSTEENVTISIGFANGSIGTVTYTSMGDTRFPKERLEVFGGGRAAVLDNFRSLQLVSGGRSVVKRSRLRQDKGHQAEWDVFRHAVLGGGPPPIPIVELAAVTTACFAAVDSLHISEPVEITSFRSE